MSHYKAWLVDNDMVIEVSGVTDKITGLAINDATINATLKDSDGANVSGITWPVVLPFVSSGLYREIIDEAAEVVHDAGYTLEIVLTTPGNYDAKWECKVGGLTRTC